MKTDEKKPLKIALLLDKFLPSRGGERYFSFLSEALAKRGHEVHVFATEVEDRYEGLPYRVHLIPIRKYPRWLRIVSFWRNSARMLKDQDFDVIHGVAQSRMVNVLNPHGGVERAYLKQEFASINNPIYYAFKYLKRYASVRHYLEVGLQQRLYESENLKKVIAISTMVKRDIIEHYHFPEEKISVVFNAVDLDRFNPRNRSLYREKKRTELGITDDRVILLLFAGNNYRLKGLETLIKALASLKCNFPGYDFRLLVAGRGHVHRYKALSGRLGVSENVLFPGALEGMEQCYAAADIYVHPTFYDSCSLTVLEALASGLPVVTSRFNGAADAIASREGGWVINDPGSASELAEAISFYIDEERRSRAGAVARSWMERYSLERNLEETLAVYYEVAGRAVK
ncbi:MAG: Lipopolysaccharide core biosynthesis protein RfaG [Syntrophorhabdaceae bacterium PtaU1.Bin034]|nr:MAG: Lipopolysaccharide core biosynthesis protein RfaG [Syntrophorhabdaceae bacterium PtaU1.Bin034]